MSFATVPELLAELRAGRPVVVVDEASRENEGDIVLAAEHATPAWVNFMVKEARGLVCVSLPEARAKKLKLEPMVAENTDAHGTAFTVSVDHSGTHTGISAFERSLTLRALAEGGKSEDFRRPGHVFPLVARPGGVLQRAGHTEASLDLVRLAGLREAAVICEVIRDDGHMARLPDLEVFAAQHRLKLGSIADLRAYRAMHDPLLKRVTEAKLPTAYGPFTIVGFEDALMGAEHVALVLGDVSGEVVLTRLHSECLTGDVFHSVRCDCGAQLDAALHAIAAEGRGVLLYLRQEGRGIGLINKLRAYALQDGGLDTVEANEALGFPADARDFSVAAQMLGLLSVTGVRLMTNNPLKLESLRSNGELKVERVPHEFGRGAHNRNYLDVKRRRLGHLLTSSERTPQLMEDR